MIEAEQIPASCSKVASPGKRLVATGLIQPVGFAITHESLWAYIVLEKEQYWFVGKSNCRAWTGAPRRKGAVEVIEYVLTIDELSRRLERHAILAPQEPER